MILLDPTRDELFNYPFVIAAPLLGILAVRRLARGSASTVRIAWMLLATGMLIWQAGAVTAAWADLVLESSPSFAGLSDYLYLTSGIAVIAALALPDRPSLVRRLFWIEIGQGLLAAVLGYVAVFSVLPFGAAGIAPIGTERMAHLFLVSNLALLALSSLRVLGRSHSAGRAAFDRAALLFLLLNAIGDTLYNQRAIATAFDPGLVSLLPDLPFLSLLLLDAAEPEPGIAPVRQRRPLTLLVDGATPAFFTLLLSWLGLSIMHERFMLGGAAVMLALLLMVLRSALTESHHHEAQDALALARDRLLRLSLHDDLTGIANRRAFQSALAESWLACRTDNSSLSLLLVDIDHFKAINDRLGHEAGDTCLRMVAGVLDRSLDQSGGRLFRYGGEEFAVLLPGAPPTLADEVAERLRAAVFCLAIPNRTETADRVTISVGVATTARGHRTTHLLVSAADRALYQAKAGGRNRVSISEELPDRVRS